MLNNTFIDEADFEQFTIQWKILDQRIDEILENHPAWNNITNYSWEPHDDCIIVLAEETEYGEQMNIWNLFIDFHELNNSPEYFKEKFKNEK